mmetsp:Transcript_40247/g.78873  ORF Transcript_40247/g.78873 Transcript_40247/m.78873 type:complete len:203 (-) Transcript_40247:1784-2392(-)
MLDHGTKLVVHDTHLVPPPRTTVDGTRHHQRRFSDVKGRSPPQPPRQSSRQRIILRACPPPLLTILSRGEACSPLRSQTLIEHHTAAVKQALMSEGLCRVKPLPREEACNASVRKLAPNMLEQHMTGIRRSASPHQVGPGSPLTARKHAPHRNMVFLALRRCTNLRSVLARLGCALKRGSAPFGGCCRAGWIHIEVVGAVHQ